MVGQSEYYISMDDIFDGNYFDFVFGNIWRRLSTNSIHIFSILEVDSEKVNYKNNNFMFSIS